MKRITRNIIDLHCDTLIKCYNRGLNLESEELQFSIDKLPRDYRICQSMAVFMPDELRGDKAALYFDNVSGLFFEQINRYRSVISQVRNTAEIEDALNQKPFAAILTVEGGSALAGELSNVQRLYDLGVRMMTLTWNAENEICGGAATDKGFTDFGRAVVSEMERLGMAVDVSHLSDRGFWELCEFAGRPFAASHSNSRAICGHRRNLTDNMFREVVRRGGVAGLNYCGDFISNSPKSEKIDDLLRHVHHFLGLGGENALALGSDYDGADIPEYIDSLNKVGVIAEALLRSGIPSGTVDKILFFNAAHFYKTISEGKSK